MDFMAGCVGKKHSVIRSSFFQDDLNSYLLAHIDFVNLFFLFARMRRRSEILAEYEAQAGGLVDQLQKLTLAVPVGEPEAELRDSGSTYRRARYFFREGACTGGRGGGRKFFWGGADLKG